MSADMLRRAATRIRHDVDFGQAYGDDHFLIGVADWLDKTAAKYDAVRDGFSEVSQVGAAVAESNTLGYSEAIAVANAYLGQEATR